MVTNLALVIYVAMAHCGTKVATDNMGHVPRKLYVQNQMGGQEDTALGMQPAGHWPSGDHCLGFLAGLVDGR
jgi:hypothetical protein